MKTNRRKFLSLSVLTAVAAAVGLVTKPKLRRVLILGVARIPFEASLRDVQKNDTFKVVSTTDDPYNGKWLVAHSDAYLDTRQGYWTVIIEPI